MFSYYKNLTIHSAIPLADIRAYLDEIGATEKSDLVYEYNNLEIKITIGINDVLKRLNVPKHTIDVEGDRASAEDFLNCFRFRFLSAGG